MERNTAVVNPIGNAFISLLRKAECSNVGARSELRCLRLTRMVLLENCSIVVVPR